MRVAENDFHEKHEKSIANDRKRLEDLESAAQAFKRSSTPIAPELVIEIKQLKEKLSRTVFVNYRDWTADRSTMMEMLSKSKFRAMSFVDELGIRAHGYTINKFLAAKNIHKDLALLSLSGDNSADSVLIRSSATGGANIVSVRGGDPPRFNLMTLTSPQAIKKIMSRLSEAAPAKGKTLPLSGAPGVQIPVQASQIARVIDKVYATEEAANRISVETSAAWQEFFGKSSLKVEDASQAAADAVLSALPSVKLLVSAITRAIITMKVFMLEPDIPGSETSGRTIQLDDSDLAQAEDWFAELQDGVFNLNFRSVRSNNLGLARQAWQTGPSLESVIAARVALVDALKEDEFGTLSFKAATRLPGVTERSLQAAIDSNPDLFKVLDNHKRPGSKRAASKAIAFADAYVEDCDDAIGSDELDETVVDALYESWQDEAEASLREGNRPVIKLNDIPSSLVAAMRQVRDKYWQSTAGIPSNDDLRTLEIWFRFKRDGRPMCAWGESFREWKVAERWEEKDDLAQSMREGREQYDGSK
jgi:hypothetical protein